MYTIKTLSASQSENRPSSRAPWPRHSVSGPTLIRESFPTTSTGQRSNPGAHCRFPWSTGQTWRYPDHPWRNPKQTGSASNTRPDQPWGYPYCSRKTAEGRQNILPVGKDHLGPSTGTDTPQTYGIIDIYGRHTRTLGTL